VTCNRRATQRAGGIRLRAAELATLTGHSCATTRRRMPGMDRRWNAQRLLRQDTRSLRLPERDSLARRQNVEDARRATLRSPGAAPRAEGHAATASSKRRWSKVARSLRLPERDSLARRQNVEDARRATLRSSGAARRAEGHAATASSKRRWSKVARSLRLPERDSLARRRNVEDERRATLRSPGAARRAEGRDATRLN